MNAKTFTTMTAIVTLLLTAFATTARADDPTPDPYQGTLGTRSRAEIVAERDAAIRQGHIAAMTGEDSGSVALAMARTDSRLTRSEVVADVLRLRRLGLLDAGYGEDSGSFAMARLGRGNAAALYAATAR
jgi:hypothetical protein